MTVEAQSPIRTGIGGRLRAWWEGGVRGRLLLLLLGWALFTSSGVALVYARAHVWPAAPPPAEAIEWALDALEAAARGDGVPPAPTSAAAYRPDAAVYVVGWSQGVPVRRVRGPGLVAAVDAAREAIAAHSDVASGWSFTVTVSLGEGAVTRHLPWISELGLVPRRDGLELERDGHYVFLTPDELVAEHAFDPGAVHPLPELNFGLDLEGLIGRLGRELPPGDATRVRRFVGATYARDAYPHDAEVTEETLLASARAGARFLLRHQRADGRFVYEYDPTTGLERAAGYNLPRHAGTTYFLAQLARVGPDDAARLGARRALGYVQRRLLRHCGPTEHLCVADSDRADLGASALTAVAAAEYLRSTDDPLIRQMLEGLMAFLRSQQRPDGEMMHEYDLAAGRAIDVQYVYYSGEAAYAFLLAYEALGDERDLEAARRVMAHLTGSGWDFLGSRYYYGAEHWTCIAAGTGRDTVHSPEALDFCRRWVDWNDHLSYRDGETPWPVSGTFGVGPLIPPRFTPVGSRTEAFIATYRLMRARHVSSPETRALIERGLANLMRWQFRPGPTHLFADAAGAAGGFPGGPVDPMVRNDFVQHAGSALLAWVEVLRAE